MTKSVDTKFDDRTLTVRIPMRFQQRRGRRRIVGLDGGELAQQVPRRRISVKALARAWRWQKLPVASAASFERLTLSTLPFFS